MTPDHQPAIRAWAACWSAHDLESLLLLFTADAIYEDVPMGVVTRGSAELRTFAADVLSRFPDISFELRSSVSNGAAGGAEWVMRGHRGRVNVRGVSMFEFAGDKIRRCSDYWDMSTYLKQLDAS